MKLKTLSLIAGTLALTLIATPFAVQAEQNSSSPQAGQEWQKKGSFKKLNLTPEQKAKIKEIRSNTRTQIEAVLTPEQKTKLQATMAEYKAQRQQGQEQRREGRGKKGDIFASLGLTAEQKAKMKEIKESSKQQMDAVLTPEQRSQIKQMRENMRSRRQQNKPQ
ncbi:MAG: P pilus assembly/Cpx signaling pathway, periplasmic inhibitor/zinc-resistance associated protein [Nostocales cyanobacterium LacPavin_0920_SED1_MAG_38_18]|jgi:Spy/CpxP family protein refolding chaperone|uniref:P pilus assembly/Cpx signaling pathway, periplasmic inhibitor/zinc-resistance associated protein n=1 Tax=Aphanizomenon flos-aquae FACHB-1040 TaxID=2692887 RepID=A0ABR8BS66_APHFL|nr:P pilus assembly/Cpx signaling pathway, periplasmic inhibitor/zinc-resistance associated protein [Aphanizomenon flos-aquae]MBD2277275.1 P pilus assembly/Cpx signaling pathway, periplasmic inhibitor/zinc-resistance associated protein [Aphanizomenon flos-aquae FACHB-1040]MCX5983283.1 P pilus assembly/Cpx signaling pathway, periplasmic inhibitor/zinc-resistance associated protein [Nostocales cyanobacterium LacPavin_0920_SED1_MAG_38_18]